MSSSMYSCCTASTYSSEGLSCFFTWIGRPTAQRQHPICTAKIRGEHSLTLTMRRRYGISPKLSAHCKSDIDINERRGMGRAV